MVKKVKRFIIFVLFSLFYSLLSGKTAEAETAAKKNTVCLIPKSGEKLDYNGIPQDVTAESVADYICS